MCPAFNQRMMEFSFPSKFRCRERSLIHLAPGQYPGAKVSGGKEAGKAGDGNTAAFTTGAAAKMTRAVRYSQVRAVNTDFGHLLCVSLQATLLVLLVADK